MEFSSRRSNNNAKVTPNRIPFVTTSASFWHKFVAEDIYFVVGQELVEREGEEGWFLVGGKGKEYVELNQLFAIGNDCMLTPVHLLIMSCNTDRMLWANTT